MTITLYITAFLLGLYGSGHCAAMCGPLISIFGVNTQLPPIKAAIFYNLGRISTYVGLGFFVGVVTLAVSDIKILQWGLRYFAAIMMVLIALQLLGLPNVLAPLEKMGQWLWRPISQQAKKFLPITSVKGAYVAGMLWGFLPCGMVYAALTQSFGGQNVWDSMIIMLFFGLGTLPAMLSMSVFGHSLGRFLQYPHTRRVAGILILIMTVFYLMTTGNSDHQHVNQTAETMTHEMNSHIHRLEDQEVGNHRHEIDPTEKLTEQSVSEPEHTQPLPESEDVETHEMNSHIHRLEDQEIGNHRHEIDPMENEKQP